MDAKSSSCVTTGSPCSIAVEAISASRIFGRAPAWRQSCVKRANAPMTASVIAIGSAARASASVSARRAR